MKPFEQQTYYEILEVPVTAPMEEIRAAYERLMELYSPDSIAVYALVDEGQVDGLRSRMAEALEILSDEELRAEYDKDLGLPARRLMDAVSTGGEVAHADAPVEKRAEPELVGVAASGAEDQTGRLSTQVPDTGTNGRPGAVRDVPVEDSETASTGRDGEGEAAAKATEPRVEQMPASLGQADFRASFFRGFSFAYVSSSLQDTQRMGSSVDVPAASIQPVGVSSAEPHREAAGSVSAASVGETAVTQGAPVVAPEAGPASAAASVAVSAAEGAGSAPTPVASPQISVPSLGSDASVTASAAVTMPATAATVSAPAAVSDAPVTASAAVPPPMPVATVSAPASVSDAPVPASSVPTPAPAAGAIAQASSNDAMQTVSAAVPTPAPVATVSATTPVSDAPVPAAAALSAATVSAPSSESSAAVPTVAAPSAATVSAPSSESSAEVPASATPPGEPATSPVPEQGATVSPVAAPSAAAPIAPTSEASAAPLPPVPASVSQVPSASQSPESESTAIVPVRPSPASEAQPEPGRAGARPGRPLGDAPQLAQDSAIATAEAALAQVSQVASRAREPRARIPDIPSDAEFNGELLRQVREARGMTLQQVADRTRITRSHLENVEADRYNLLPPAVYLRGILMNLARELGLDPLRVSKSYLALASEKSGRK